MKKLLIFLNGLFLISGLNAQDPGDLDITYGVDGVGTISYVGQTTSLYGMGVQSSDRVIAGGYLSNMAATETNVFVARLDETGMLDDFGNNINFFMYNYDENESVMATYVLPDDQIIIAGYYDTGFPFVSRLHADGTLDPLFGTAGSYINEAISFVPKCIDVYTTTAGYNILMSGYSSDYHPLMLMLDQNGNAVSSFGTDGLYEFTGSTGIMLKLEVDSDEEYIYTCGEDVFSSNAFVSKHHLSDGSLVLSFNSTGYLLIEPFGDALEFNAFGLVLNKENEKLAVFGSLYHTGGDLDIYAIRLNTNDGSFNNSFGLNGWSTLRALGSDEIIFDALQQSDDKYYFGGTTDINGTSDFMLGRLNSDGMMDLTFGENGFVITDIGASEIVLDIALSENQSRIFAGGDIDLSSQHEIKIACYHTGFTVGVSDPETVQAEISIYPNPTTDIINIETGKDDSYQIGIYGLAVKCLLQKKERGYKFQLDIKELPQGIYMLRLTNSNNNSSNFKLIKQ